MVGKDEDTTPFDRFEVAAVFLRLAAKAIGESHGPGIGGVLALVDLAGEFLASHHARRPRVVALVGASGVKRKEVRSRGRGGTSVAAPVDIVVAQGGVVTGGPFPHQIACAHGEAVLSLHADKLVPAELIVVVGTERFLKLGLAAGDKLDVPAVALGEVLLKEHHVHGFSRGFLLSVCFGEGNGLESLDRLESQNCG